MEKIIYLTDKLLNGLGVFNLDLYLIRPDVYLPTALSVINIHQSLNMNVIFTISSRKYLISKIDLSNYKIYADDELGFTALPDKLLDQLIAENFRIIINNNFKEL